MAFTGSSPVRRCSGRGRRSARRVVGPSPRTLRFPGSRGAGRGWTSPPATAGSGTGSTRRWPSMDRHWSGRYSGRSATWGTPTRRTVAMVGRRRLDGGVIRCSDAPGLLTSGAAMVSDPRLPPALRLARHTGARVMTVPMVPKPTRCRLASPVISASPRAFRRRSGRPAYPRGIASCPAVGSSIRLPTAPRPGGQRASRSAGDGLLHRRRRKRHATP